MLKMKRDIDRSDFKFVDLHLDNFYPFEILDRVNDIKRVKIPLTFSLPYMTEISVVIRQWT